MVQFDSFPVPEAILRSLKEMGFSNATPIQEAVIPLLLNGRDAVAQAQTGTGKTAAFGVPLVAAALEGHLGMVLAPTRELAQQVSAEINRIGKAAGISSLPLYGGAAFQPQAKELQSGRHAIIVATPGRLRDHIERGTFDPKMASIIVLDEADEMLKMGFVEEVEAVLEAIGPERQTLLFSATMPEPIVRLAERYLNDPEYVSVRGANDSVATASTEQHVVFCEQRAKLDALVRILAVERPESAIAFRHTRDGVDQLVKQLTEKGVAADALHGGMAQGHREEVLARLRAGKLKMVVATNVAARGLDVDTLTHVFNFDAPMEADSYVHRIGRTGRAGREGRSFLFVSHYERNRLRNIERILGARLAPYDVPTDDNVAEGIAHHAREWVRSAALTINPHHRAIVDELVAEGADPATLATKLLGRLAVHEGFDVPQLESHRAPQAPKRANREFGGKPAGGPLVALAFNVGRDDGVRPADIVGALTNEGKLVGADVGRIDILPRMSVAEVPESRVDEVMNTMARSNIRGRGIEMRVARQWQFRAAPRANMRN